MQFVANLKTCIAGAARPRSLAFLMYAVAVLPGCTMAWERASLDVRESEQSAVMTESWTDASAKSAPTGSPSNDSDVAGREPPIGTDVAADLQDSQTTSGTRGTDLEVDDRDSSNTELTSHIVRAGDTLTKIAERYDVSIRALLNANDVPNPDFLRVGQVLKLPEPPADFTPAHRILPDSRLVRSIGASSFDIDSFVESQPGVLREMTVLMPTRQANGTSRSEQMTGSQIIDRVSREYSVDARILLTFLDYFAGLVSDPTGDGDAQLYPLLAAEPGSGKARQGLYYQVSWLADQLNEGYYDWKYRGKTILDVPDGSRLYYHPNLNAGSIAVQYAVAQFRSVTQWETDINSDGLRETYQQLFGDPFSKEYETVPADLRQPELTLPFPRGDVWRYTGGFHGGWGNGSAWSAIDFAPPDKATSGWCYTSEFPVTAAAGGVIARMVEGVVLLDLDGDGDEGSGWTLLYLHITSHDALAEGQAVEVGNILGYASCLGGYSTATHLHFARLYNGEWLPADCNRCPAATTVPPFVMSSWKVVGLGSQLYQGFLVHTLDNRSVVAEQGRFTNVNAISW